MRCLRTRCANSGSGWWRASGWEDHGLVFPNTLGKPLEPRNVVRSFKHRLGTLGLPDARFYDLRHTCASFLLAQGVEPRVVMEILGHSQYSFTMKTYAHLLPLMRHAPPT